MATTLLHECVKRENEKFLLYFMCEKHLDTLRLTKGTYLKYKGQDVGIFDWKTLPTM